MRVERGGDRGPRLRRRVSSHARRRARHRVALTGLSAQRGPRADAANHTLQSAWTWLVMDSGTMGSKKARQYSTTLCRYLLQRRY